MHSRSLLLGLFASLAAGALADTGTPEFVSGVLLVKPKAGQTSAVRAAYKAMGAKLTRTIPQIGWETIRLKSGMTVQSALTKLAAVRSVAAAEPSHIYRTLELPNDAMVGAQYSLTKMQLGNAWGIAKAGKEAIVAIVDTGVDVNHPDLKASCIPGYDTADGGDTNVMGTNPHGTHCAGIAAATGNNGIGIAGIAYGASIMPIKVFPDGFDGAYDDAISAGIIWATDNGANVVSMSLGGPGATGGMLKDAIDYAYAKNVVVIAAAGNSNTNVRFSPAEYEKCIAVGASDQNDARAGFSNYGADWVDVAAPGVDIRSTVFDNGYADYSGTSMACPNVAGLATLLISYAGVGTLTNDQIRAAIEESCDPLEGDWVEFGRVNAFLAVSAVGVPITDAPAPKAPVPYDGSVTYSEGAFSVEDGVSATIRSIRRSGVGLTGSFTTGFDMTGMTLDELRTAQLTLSVTGEPLVTIQIFLQDLSGTWKMISSQPGRPAGRTTDITVVQSDLVKYMTGAGRLNVMVRSFAPIRLASRLKGIIKVDLLKVNFKGVRKPGTNP